MKIFVRERMAEIWKHNPVSRPILSDISPSCFERSLIQSDRSIRIYNFHYGLHVNLNRLESATKINRSRLIDKFLTIEIDEGSNGSYYYFRITFAICEPRSILHINFYKSTIDIRSASLITTSHVQNAISTAVFQGNGQRNAHIFRDRPNVTHPARAWPYSAHETQFEVSQNCTYGRRNLL